jgi:DNA-binding NtrC family response regulator
VSYLTHDVKRPHNPVFLDIIDPSTRPFASVVCSPRVTDRAKLSLMHTKADTAIVPASLLGESPTVRRSRALLEAAGGGPLLILADEGLDASAAARYAHDRTRAGQPFRHVDCAQPEIEALDAALFGVRSRAAGELEALGAGSALLHARRGTLFLERIGELPAALQRRLARVMRDGEARVATRQRVRLDARIVATAAPSLTADARDGRFRADLLRRFATTPVTIPALRERTEDLPAIVSRVACDLAGPSRPAPGFTPAALTMLAALPWTGNLDELRATLTRGLAQAEGRVVRQEDLLPAVPGLARRMPPLASLRDARRRFERDYIASVLEQHGWRMSEAARILGIERANLYRKTRELGIQRSVPGGRRHP